VYVGGTPRKIWGFSKKKLLNTKDKFMHRTSSTQLSNLIDSLRELDDKLDQASFTPMEELLGILVAGSIVLNSLADKTTKAQFTDDEVSFIESLVDRIEENLQEIYADNEPNERDSYENDREGWEYPEWDN